MRTQLKLKSLSPAFHVAVVLHALLRFEGLLPTIRVSPLWQLLRRVLQGPEVLTRFRRTFGVGHDHLATANENIGAEDVVSFVPADGRAHTFFAGLGRGSGCELEEAILFDTKPIFTFGLAGSARGKHLRSEAPAEKARPEPLRLKPHFGRPRSPLEQVNTRSLDPQQVKGEAVVKNRPGHIRR